jgi:hypothetical protein
VPLADFVGVARRSLKPAQYLAGKSAQMDSLLQQTTV